MKHTYLSLFFISFLIQPLFAAHNVDSIFSKSIDQAKNQQYALSLLEAQKATAIDPSRGDILVHIANVYSWQEKNDSAMIYIGKAKQADYRTNDFYESWTNILLRQGNYSALLDACDEAEKQHYTAEDILKKRMLAYAALKDYDKGVALARQPENATLIKSDPFSNLYLDLLLHRNKNVITANYTIDMYDDRDPQHLASLGYMTRFGVHTAGIRVNYTNRFGLQDMQAELDAYLKFRNSNYLYLNYGYGFDAVLFPRHRAGAEYFIPLKHGFEVSAGGRLMSYTGNDVYILTGHAGKYLKNNWIAFRPFYVYSTQRGTQSLSAIASYRLTGRNERNYWGLELGFGNSPDETYAVTQLGGFNQLDAYKVKIEKNFMLTNVSDLRIAIGYAREEYQVGIFRNKYSFETGYKFRFK